MGRVHRQHRRNHLSGQNVEAKEKTLQAEANQSKPQEAQKQKVSDGAKAPPHSFDTHIITHLYVMDKKINIAMSVFTVAVALQFVTKNTNVLSIPAAVLCAAWIAKLAYEKARA